ncbi:MAG: YtxH domain-containing protein [Myxococcales bacterium]
MTLTERLSDLRGLSKADVLAAIGLASKRSASEKILGSLSIFGVGLLVGAAAALLLAPKPGTELREDLGQRFKKLREERLGQGGEATNSAIGSMGSLSRDEVRT